MPVYGFKEVTSNPFFEKIERMERWMKVVEGDRFMEQLSGQLFRVRRIEADTVILEGEDRPNKFLIGDGVLDLLFDKVES
jgi:hypothetical protein